MVAGLLLIDLVLLITWQIVDPLRLKIQNLTLEVIKRIVIGILLAFMTTTTTIIMVMGK